MPYQNAAAFDSATRCLSEPLRRELTGLPDEEKACTEELRFRVGQPITLTVSGRAHCVAAGRLRPFAPDPALTRLSAQDMDTLFAALCRWSVHACQDQLRQGFVTVDGGHRAGVCGTVVTEQGRVVSMRQITSVNLRIARSVPGAADEVLARWRPSMGGLLLAGPPGCGKTTVLRDLARRLPPETDRIALIDERGELAGVSNGVPGLDIGPACDVLTGCPKSEGILIAVRTLSPQVVICDELGGAEDAEAVRMGANTGCIFAASLHAGSAEEALLRPQTRTVAETGAFRWLCFLDSVHKGRVLEWREL